MAFHKRLREISHSLRQRLTLHTAIYRDPRTPWLARCLLGAALAYLALPFDLIPDFLPVVGHLDDVLIVPGLIFLALRLVPSEIYDDHRQRLLMPR